MKSIGKLFIIFYRKCLTKLFPSRCRYMPSCSSYTYQAIDKYGLFLGSILGGLRILRCNPVSKGGFNPVKDFYFGKIKWLL